ncbi:MAG TPA: methyltransferase domain-containing protein [Devosiaceae bacterium]|nr:methyltransferase domain-containing protein [Devosiaceae bacterium]
MGRRMDTRNEGLDVMMHVARAFADSPWLHYGLWEPGERANFPNLRAAQERYVDKLMTFLPPPPRRVLDIGGGTGEMARLLAGKGYAVDMITPSAAQAKLARQRLGDAGRVFETRFQDFGGERRYDVCLWSESFQYVPLKDSLPGMKHLLAEDGAVVIADCFRSPAYTGGRAPGGGHRYRAFLEAVRETGYAIEADEDLTEAAAPTFVLDQTVYRDFVAPVAAQLSGSLKARRPLVHGLAALGYRIFTKRAEREAMTARLAADYRTPEAFKAANTYRFVRLRLGGGGGDDGESRSA